MFPCLFPIFHFNVSFQEFRMTQNEEICTLTRLHFALTVSRTTTWSLELKVGLMRQVPSSVFPHSSTSSLKGLVTACAQLHLANSGWKRVHDSEWIKEQIAHRTSLVSNRKWKTKEDGVRIKGLPKLRQPFWLQKSCFRLEWFGTEKAWERRGRKEDTSNTLLFCSTTTSLYLSPAFQRYQFVLDIIR